MNTITLKSVNEFKINRNFIIIQISAIALFLFTLNKLTLALTAGVHLIHLIIFLLLTPGLIILFLAFNLEILFTGKVSNNLAGYYINIIKNFYYTFAGIMNIGSGLAPFFMQEDNDFSVRIEIGGIYANRLNAFFRILGITFILCIPQLIIILLLVPFWIVLCLYSLIYMIIKNNMPWFYFKFSLHIFNFLFHTFNYLLGFETKYPGFKFKTKNSHIIIAES